MIHFSLFHFRQTTTAAPFRRPKIAPRPSAGFSAAAMNYEASGSVLKLSSAFVLVSSGISNFSGGGVGGSFFSSTAYSSSGLISSSRFFSLAAFQAINSENVISASVFSLGGANGATSSAFFNFSA